MEIRKLKRNASKSTSQINTPAYIVKEKLSCDDRQNIHALVEEFEGQQEEFVNAEIGNPQIQEHILKHIGCFKKGNRNFSQQHEVKNTFLEKYGYRYTV